MHDRSSANQALPTDDHRGVSVPVPVKVYRNANGVDGLLALSGDSLVLSIEDRRYDLAVDQLECRAGGLNDTVLFLRHPEIPDGEIALERSNTEGLKHLPAIQASMAAAPRLVRRQRLFWSAIAALALLIAGLVLSLLLFLVRAWF